MISSIYQLLFVEPSSPIQEGIIWFHDELMVILVFVVIFVGVFLFFSSFFYFDQYMINRNGIVHGVYLESIWTIIPGIILGIVTIPSFALLYSVEDHAIPMWTIKIIGKQWYWTYEYIDIDEESFISYDSYMLAEDELQVGELRLLEVDNRLQIPSEVYIRILVTASDVLHAFAIPSFGVKIDAVPGKLNEFIFYVERPGTFYGQCSELCGVNHAFMPIVIDSLQLTDYLEWYYQATTNYWLSNWSNWEYSISIR